MSILQYYSENSVSDDVDITPHVTGETSEYLGRLLIGDDEPRLLNSLCSILRDKGFEVDGAEDGDAVCQRLRENAYDLVLLDIRMPGKSGLEIMAWLKETGVDVRAQNGQIVFANESDQLDAAEINARVLPCLLDAGIGIHEIIQGRKLEDEYLESRERFDG